MKWYIRGLVAFTACFLSTATHFAYAKADYSLVLIGGGLDFCTSQTTRECVKPLKISTEHHVDYAYIITEERLKELQKSRWQANREPQKQQLISAIQVAGAATKGVLTKRQLLTALRDAEITHKGKKTRGSDFLQTLHDDEFHIMMDILQKEDLERNILSSDERRKVMVDLKNSKSHFSQKVLREFIRQSKTLTDKKRPNIVLITAANRDQFESVDLYSQILSELGANVTWLPVELALFAAIEQDKVQPDAESCENIEAFRQELQGVYARDRLFPSLTKTQNDYCEDPSLIQTVLDDAHGIYFTDGESHRLRDTFINRFSLSDELLQSVKKRMLASELVVAADQASAMALSGGSSPLSKPVMLLDGNSHKGLLTGSFVTDKPLEQCEKINDCPSNFESGQITYMREGLGLFPYGVIDTQFSELGRQGRLVQLTSESGSKMGYGIDERTALLVGADFKNDMPLRMEVIGENGVSIFDTSEVEQDKGFANSILSVKSHYLTDEDKLFFRNNKLIISFADWKYSGNSRSRPIIKSGGAFNKDNYRRTLSMLCATGADKAMMKHSVLGVGHTLYVTKSRTSISLAGKRNVAGKNYSFCSYRDYYLDINAI